MEKNVVITELEFKRHTYVLASLKTMFTGSHCVFGKALSNQIFQKSVPHFFTNIDTIFSVIFKFNSIQFIFTIWTKLQQSCVPVTPSSLKHVCSNTQTNALQC